MLDLLIIVPLLIAALSALALRGRRVKYVKYLALIASLCSLALIIFSNTNASQTQSFTWFSLSGYQFSLSTSTMPLNMLLLLIVGAITPLIILYSIGFMGLPSEQSRYYSELSIFAAAMMLFAMAGDFITMLIGWELLGLTSYLLIGFWHQKEGTVAAARKAITTILIGDVLMLLAMLVIWNSFHTFSFAAIVAQSSVQTSGIGIALVLIMLAVFTKSAQFPFHEWLPDAMKGPTPVSAFLHSSTMVKAGVFLIAVLLPLFVAYHLLYLLLIFGIVTAIIGATNALAETNIKRVLAYSTIEDLGLMFVALGTGSLIAAMMLFLVQTFYKALLFLNAGAIIKANNYEEDMTKLYNPVLSLIFLPTLLGAASLAGLFPLSGFFGKSGVIVSTGNPVVYLALLLIGLLSSIYIFRWFLLPLRKKSDRKKSGVRTGYRTMPLSMTIPIYILTLLVVVGSCAYIYLPIYLSQKFLIGFSEIIISTILVAIGIIVSYLFFYSESHYFEMEPRDIAYKILYNNMIVNRFYLLVTQFAEIVSNAMDEFDHSFYMVIKKSVEGTEALSNQLKRLEDGNTNTYIALFVAGLIVILILFML